ncbi:TPA: hypothetical protein ACH3X1_009219 [Trebouxia sp. C0004]
MTGWSFAAVENPHFVSFMQHVRPNFQLPSTAPSRRGQEMAAEAAALQASAAKAQKAARAAAAKLASDKGAANEAAEAKAIAQEHKMAAAATDASATLATGKGAVTHIVGTNAGKSGCGKDGARRALQQLAGPNTKKVSTTSAGNEPFRDVRGIIKDDDEDDE